MRWQRKPVKNLKDWNLWFAWRPVLIGETRVWLEYIERRAEFWYAGIDWHYRFVREKTNAV